MSTEVKVTKNGKKVVKAITKETFLCLFLIIGLFAVFISKMGMQNTFGTLIATAYAIVLEVVLFIMAVAVITGALAGLLSEFGGIALINKILSPLMKPLYNLPGASALGVISTYLSDNPAIIPLGQDKGFMKYFVRYQRALLTNLGTAFGMGLIVTTFMLGLSDSPEMILAVVVGNLGVIVGSIVSVRLMTPFAKKYFGDDAMSTAIDGDNTEPEYDIMNYREIREGNGMTRVMSALLDGGKNGVDLGLAIIPGNVIICTLVMMLVKGPGPEGLYTGGAWEGIAFFPWLGGQLSFILNPLFGFTSPEAIAFPFTSVGSVGASLGMVPEFLKSGLIGPNDIAVFTAIGMCYSGFLTVHVAMMDALNCRGLATKAIGVHAIAGICAGVFAHWAFIGLSSIMF